MNGTRPGTREGASREYFDEYAESYVDLHAKNIRLSGEDPAFFAEYKIRAVREELGAAGVAPKRILDFGGGIGNSVPYFRKHFPDAEIVCLDVSAESLQKAEERFGGLARFIPFDGATVPYPDRSFDLAFAAGVFHHVPAGDHVAILSELRRVLAPDGHLCIFEHNPLNPLTRWAVSTCEFDEDAVLIRAGRLRERLLSAGFGSAQIKYRMFFPSVLRWLRRFEPKLAALPLGAQYSVFATPLRKPR